MYDARKPRILVSASGQCTGPYYKGETTEYVLKADADRLAAALRDIQKTRTVWCPESAHKPVDAALAAYEEGNTTK